MTPEDEEFERIQREMLIKGQKWAKDKQAEQAEPPRVWIDHRIHGWPDCFVMQPDPPHTTALYTHPAREPLTDEQIWNDDGIMAANSGYGATFDTLRELTRAIEAAHGIKGKA